MRKFLRVLLGIPLWIVLLPIDVSFTALCYLFAWFIALFYENRDGLCDNGNSTAVEPRLYTWLKWCDTVDNSLLGDNAWKGMEKDHWEWRVKLAGWPKLQAYIGRVGWLMRNPAYGFERGPLAANVYFLDKVFCYGDTDIRDKPKGKAGVCFCFIRHYWNLVWVKRVGSRCIKINIGWNIKTYAENPDRVKSEPIAQYVCSPRLPSFSTSD